MNSPNDIRCDLSDAAGLLNEIRRRDKIITALMNQVQRNLNNPDNDFSLLQTTFVLEEEVQHRTRELEHALNDVSERKLAEASLRKSQQLLQDIIDNSTALIYVKDLEGRYLLINRGLEEMLNATAFFGLCMGRESILGKTDHDLFPKEQADAYRAFDQQVLAAGKAMETEETALLEDGLHTYISVKAPLRDEQGKTYAICGVSTDITERKRLEAQLHEVQKMEAVGRLAGGIAHDFNNLMTIITGYGELLRDALGNDPLQEKVEQILRAGAQANSLTSQLLAFTRRQMLQPRLLDLNGVLADMVKMLRRVVSEDIELVIVSDPEQCLIHADGGQIQQVILNLLINARDATPKGGRITLAVNNVMFEEEQARLYAGAQPGPYVRLTVSDTGHGMNAEVRARIFEPFFTTKEQGKGTGLGLSTVYGIVQQTGAHIVVESEPGRGATFCIYFRRAEGLLPNEEHIAAQPVSGSETILVVEDQEGLRILMGEILRRNGYTVMPAANGDEALRLAALHPAKIDLMITDLIMPKMGGREVAEGLPNSHPETKVLYMSGYVEDLNELLAFGHAFIDKPFSPDSLLRKVREVLDSSVNSRLPAA